MILKPNKISTSLHFEEINLASTQSFSFNNNYSRFLDKHAYKDKEKQGILDLAQVKSEINPQKQINSVKLYSIQLRGDNQDFISQQDKLKSIQFFEFLQKLTQVIRIQLIIDLFRQFKRWFYIYGNISFSKCIFKISSENKQLNLFANQSFCSKIQNQTQFQNQNTNKKVLILIYLSKKSQSKQKKINQNLFIQEFLILFDKYLLQIQDKISLNIMTFSLFLEKNLAYISNTVKKSKFVKRTRSDSVWPFAKIQNCLRTSKASIGHSQTSIFDQIISKKVQEYQQTQIKLNKQKKQSTLTQKQIKIKKATSFSHVYENRQVFQHKQEGLYSSSNRKSALHIIKQEKPKQFFKSISPKKVFALKKNSIEKSLPKKQSPSKSFMKLAYLKQKQNENMKQIRPISQPNSFTHIPEFLRGKKSPKKSDSPIYDKSRNFKKKQTYVQSLSQKIQLSSIQCNSQSFCKFKPFQKIKLVNEKFLSPRNNLFKNKISSPLKEQQKKLNKTCKTGFSYKLKQTSTTLNTYDRTNSKSKQKNSPNSPQVQEYSKLKTMSSNSLSLNLNTLENQNNQKEAEKKKFASSSLQIKRIFSTITKREPSMIKNIYKLELQAVKESKMSQDKTERVVQVSQQYKQVQINTKNDQILNVQSQLENLFQSNQIEENLQEKQIQGLKQQFQELLK